MGKSVTLREGRDEHGSRYLGASITPDGALKIEGQDLGSGVTAFFGEDFTEYEYGLTIQPAAIPSLREALGIGGDLLSALQSHFAKPDTPDPKSLLDAHAIPYEFWSRIGD